MNILLLTHAISRGKDDHPQFINELALAYQQAGHSIEVLTASHHSIDKTQLDPRLNFSFYRYAPKRLERLGYGETLKADLALNLGDLLFTPLMLLFGVLALRRKIKQFTPDIIHVHWALPNGPIAALGTMGLNTKYIISFPGSDVTAMGTNGFFKALGRFSCKRAIALTTNSPDLRNAVVGYGVPKGKFHFVLYGSDAATTNIDPGFIDKIRHQHHIRSEDKLILAVGRMVPKKGFRYLINALPLINQKLHGDIHFKLILIGDGVLRDSLQTLCSKLEVEDQVIFMRRIAYSELPQFYLMADILAMPAVREPADGLGVVVTEAMKYGLPIAATNVGGYPLIVTDGENGYLCDEKNAAAFSDILIKLLSNPDKAASMGEIGQKIFQQKASWERIVEQYVDIIEHHHTKT